MQLVKMLWLSAENVNFELGEKNEATRKIKQEKAAGTSLITPGGPGSPVCCWVKAEATRD